MKKAIRHYKYVNTYVIIKKATNNFDQLLPK